MSFREVLFPFMIFFTIYFYQIKDLPPGLFFIHPFKHCFTSSMEPCPACGGTGLRRNLEWQSLQALRDIARLLRSRATSPCRYEMTQELGLYVLLFFSDGIVGVHLFGSDPLLDQLEKGVVLQDLLIGI